MSIELRIAVEGKCSCGIPFAVEAPPPLHHHHIECDWGRIEYTCPRKIRGKPGHVEFGHLILTTAGAITELLSTGEPLYCNDCITTATTDGQRVFMHAEAENGRWTWELFEAHFADGKGKGTEGIMVGRWPD